MPTVDKTNAVLEGMVSQVQNRRNGSGTVAATAATAGKTAEPTLSGSVEQAKEAVERFVERVGFETSAMRVVADTLDEKARQFAYTMDLVFSVFTPGKKPVNVEDARKKAEAEADARHAQRAVEERPPADPETIAEMVAAAPPILAKPDGWVCPDHGKVITKQSARTGREYKACPVDGCIEIERRSWAPRAGGTSHDRPEGPASHRGSGR